MARSEATIKDAIENLEELLDSGASTVTQDGHTTVFDPKAARIRLQELKKELSQLRGKRPRRPLFVKIRLDGE